MNRIIASAGIMAVGAAGVHAANYGDLSPEERSKPWSVSASLRAFYDDNYNTVNAAQAAAVGDKVRSSFGFELKPGASVFYLPDDQTYLGLAYVYSLKWFEDRSTHQFDQSHEITAKVDHRFSERFRANFNESFVYSQEPETLSGSGTPLRQNADALRNRAAIKLTSKLTERWELESGYQNVYWDFRDPTYSAQLDRVEHSVWIDPRFQLTPSTVLLGGYQFRYTDYLDQFRSASDNVTHYGYVGAETAVSAQLNVAAKVGVEYTHYMHLGVNDLGPYADISATYTYLPGSSLSVGLREDVVPVDDITARSQDSTSIYASLHHRITPNLTGSVLGQLTHTTFNGGLNDGAAENQFLIGLNFDYKFTDNLSGEFGYNFDRLDSDVGRSYSRNRVYAGVRLGF